MCFTSLSSSLCDCDHLFGDGILDDGDDDDDVDDTGDDATDRM